MCYSTRFIQIYFIFFKKQLLSQPVSRGGTNFSRLPVGYHRLETGELLRNPFLSVFSGKQWVKLIELLTDRIEPRVSSVEPVEYAGPVSE